MNMAANDAGRTACIAVSAPTALRTLAAEPAVSSDPNAAAAVAKSLAAVEALSPPGKNSGHRPATANPDGAGHPIKVLDVSAVIAELSTPGIAPARAVAILRDFAGDHGVGLAAARAIAEASSTLDGQAKCLAASAPSALAAFAAHPVAMASADAALWTSQAIANIAGSTAGLSACISASTPAALVKLAGQHAIMNSPDAVQYVAKALSNIAESDDGESACVAASAPAALVALAGQPAVVSNADAAHSVARALAVIADGDVGAFACIAASAPSALVVLSGQSAVKTNADAAQWVARALANIAASSGDAGASACIAASAPAALVLLAGEPAIKGNADAAQWVAAALLNISQLDAGALACVAASAPAALVMLAGETAVTTSTDAASYVASALCSIAGSDNCTSACVAAAAPAALVMLASQPAVKASARAAEVVAWALSNIAGSDDGNSACVAEFAPAALVMLAGQPAIKASAEAAARVAWALSNIASSENGTSACVAASAPAALVMLAGQPVVKASADAAQGVARALGEIADRNDGNAACIAASAPEALVMLAGQPAIMASADAAENVVWALSRIAENDAGASACAAVSAPAALVTLAGQPAAKASVDVARCVAMTLASIALCNEGKSACIASSAPAALVMLAGQPAVKTNADAVQYVAGALANIADDSNAGKSACIAASAPAALVMLAGQPAVKASADAAQTVAMALSNIAEIDAGASACVAAFAPAALVVLARLPAIRASADAAENVAAALSTISAAPGPNRAACVAAGAIPALQALAAQAAVLSSVASMAAVEDALEKLRHFGANGVVGFADGAAPGGGQSALGLVSWSSLVPDDSALPVRGGMGTIFKARWVKRGLDVAVKLLRASVLAPDEFARAATALEREAATLRLASEGGANRFVVAQHGTARGPPTEAWRTHLGNNVMLFARHGGGGVNGTLAAASPAISSVAGVGASASPMQPPGELFGLVMAWHEGGSLAALLHGGAVTWSARTPERLLLLERVAEGVNLLHSAEPTLIVHGDLKSDNVLLTAEGEPRLIDFGIAEVKRVITTSAGSVAAKTRAAGENAAASGDHAGGTWPYMAPEMYKSKKAAALPASTATDVYALATLCWEVLTGERPWADSTEPERISALRSTGDDAENLDWSRLPGDVPAVLRAQIEAGVALDRVARPTARELRDALRAAREQLESGHYDIFLSHSWDGSKHAPATSFIWRALRDKRHRVWVDETDMGHDLVKSMHEGIAASTVFVALVSRSYAKSNNCMLELREALRLGKPFIACLVEPDETWWPPASAKTNNERELAAAIDTKGFMFVDFRKACAAGNWAEPVPATLLQMLNADEAAPRLLRLVEDELRLQRERGLR
jgi:serine/threonine protein kinase